MTDKALNIYRVACANALKSVILKELQHPELVGALEHLKEVAGKLQDFRAQGGEVMELKLTDDEVARMGRLPIIKWLTVDHDIKVALDSVTELRRAVEEARAVVQTRVQTQAQANSFNRLMFIHSADLLAAFEKIGFRTSSGNT